MIGIDLDEASLRAGARPLANRGRELGRLGAMLQADAFRLPFRSETFDRVICAHDYGIPKEQVSFWDEMFRHHGFDAARTLFQVRLTYHRLVADYWISLADIERAIARPFPEDTP